MSASFVWPALIIFACACRSSSKPPPPAPGWSGLETQVMGMPEAQQGGRAVILLHGWGAPGDDLVPLARELARPDTRFIVPAAPLPHPLGGRAWWHLDLERLQRARASGHDASDAVPAGLAEARTKVLALIAGVRQRYHPSALVVAGFSQGGILAVDAGLAAEPPVDGIASLSGTLISQTIWRERMARPNKPPVLISHGRGDGTLPFAMSERLAGLFRENGFAVTWVPFEGGHDIPPPVVDALAAFISGS